MIGRTIVVLPRTQYHKNKKNKEINALVTMVLRNFAAK